MNCKPCDVSTPAAKLNLRVARALLSAGLILASFALLPGCEKAEVKFEPRDLEGKVDTSLPKPLQTKQEIVARWLRGMQQGIGELAGLRLLVPGVDMRESFDQFYNQHKRLVRWEFGAKPQGNDVPVVLYFDEVESGVYEESKLVREERTYSVSSSGSRWVIAKVIK